MLNAEGIRASYGRIPILHGIDLQVAEGEFVGILGHNGMGKTTLLKTLIGLVKTTDGSITFEGEAITREPPHKAQPPRHRLRAAGARDLPPT